MLLYTFSPMGRCQIMRESPIEGYIFFLSFSYNKRHLVFLKIPCYLHIIAYFYVIVTVSDTLVYHLPQLCLAFTSNRIPEVGS